MEGLNTLNPFRIDTFAGKTNEANKRTATNGKNGRFNSSLSDANWEIKASLFLSYYGGTTIVNNVQQCGWIIQRCVIGDNKLSIKWQNWDHSDENCDVRYFVVVYAIIIFVLHYEYIWDYIWKDVVFFVNRVKREVTIALIVITIWVRSILF